MVVSSSFFSVAASFSSSSGTGEVTEVGESLGRAVAIQVRLQMTRNVRIYNTG